MLAVALALAAFASQQRTQAEPPSLSVLAGVVRNAITGNPAEGVAIRLVPYATGHADRAATLESRTNSEGIFRFEEIQPGSYRLIAQGEGFVSMEYGAQRPRQIGATIRLSAGQEMTDLQFPLIPTGVISGRVLDENGKPMAHVEVSVLAPYYLAGRRMLRPASGDRTNDLGEYRAFRVAPGRYYLSATLRPWLGGVDRLSRSGADKKEYVTTFHPGVVDMASAVPVQVAPGQELPGYDFQLVKEPVVRVSGQVIKPADAGPVTVRLIPEWLAGLPGWLRTDASAEGRFEFPGVVAGKYKVLAEAMSSDGRIIGLQAIEVGNEDLKNLVVFVQPGVELRGVLRTDNQDPLPAGIRRVILFPAENTGLIIAPVTPATVNADGTFSVTKVGPERYAVEVEPLPEEHYVKSVRIGDRDYRVEGIDWAASWLPGSLLEVVISGKAAQVKGIVRTKEGKVAPGATVVLIPESPEKQRIFQFVQAVTADQDGMFSLTSVEPGEYKLYAWADVEVGAWMDAEFLKEYSAKGERVKLRESQQETVNLTLIDPR